MKQKSGWKRITLLRKTSFKKRLKILAGYKRQTGTYSESEGSLWEVTTSLSTCLCSRGLSLHIWCSALGLR